MDSFEYSAVLIDLDAGEGEAYHLTNSPEDITHGGNLYKACPGMEIPESTISGDFSTEEYRINNLNASFPVLIGLAANLPYPKVRADVKEVFYDLDGVETATQYLLRGFVYQVFSRRRLNQVDLSLKDAKYYLDTTAGVACTELCAAPYFGDPYICKKAVYSESHEIASISGYEITLTGPLLDSTAGLFRSGYMEYGAQRIKVKYHDTGLVFQMARRVPVEWDGADITLYAGCDKQLTTCRNIHSNEDRFLGLGIAMVDYNIYYEST